MAKPTSTNGRESGTGQDTPLGVCPCPAPLPATPCGTWRDIVPSCPAVTHCPLMESKAAVAMLFCLHTACACRALLVLGVLMPKRIWVKPRRVAINGHQTSIRLEPEFWYWLRQIAAECGTTATKLIEGIVIAKNPDRPLSSALRVSVAGYFHASAPRYGFPDPESRFAVRFEKPRKSRKRGIKG